MYKLSTNDIDRLNIGLTSRIACKKAIDDILSAKKVPEVKPADIPQGLFDRIKNADKYATPCNVIKNELTEKIEYARAILGIAEYSDIEKVLNRLQDVNLAIVRGASQEYVYPFIGESLLLWIERAALKGVDVGVRDKKFKEGGFYKAVENNKIIIKCNKPAPKNEKTDLALIS
jgi:hypothetical protein